MFREGSGGGAKTFRWCVAASEIYFTSSMLQLKAKAKHPLYLREAATSGTIENVGCELPPRRSENKLKQKFGSPTKNGVRILCGTFSHIKRLCTQPYPIQRLAQGNSLRKAHWKSYRARS